MSIVGRDAEQAQITRLLDSGAPGSRALLVEGPVGIGKSTLVTMAVAHARAEGWTVLHCNPGSNETGYDYAGLADLMAHVDLPAIPDVQRRALDTATRHVHAVQPQDPHLVAAAVTSVLGALAGRGPVLLVVDDLQWLDRATDAALRFACRRVTDAPIAVLVSRRADHPGAPPWDLPFERLWLHGLSQDELHELVLGRLHSPLPRPVLARLHATCQGNPLMAMEMAAALVRRDPEDPWPVPESLVRVIEPRLRSLDQNARDVLLAASSMTCPTVERLRAALGDGVADGLDAAELAGLVQVHGNTVTFAHPLFATVLYGEAPAPRRRAVHRRLASVEPESRARHLALGTIGPDEAVAQSLENAARRHVPDAAELLRLARSKTPSDAAAADGRRVVLLADALCGSGDLTAARELLDEEMPKLATGLVRARALMTRGTIAWHQENRVLAAKLLESALDEAKADQRLTGLVHSRLSVYYANDRAEAHRHADEAVSALADSDAPDALAVASISLCHTETQLGLPPRAEVLERGIETDSTIPGLWYLSTDSTVDRARDWFSALLARGDEARAAELHTHLGEVELVAGNLAAARRHADAATIAAAQIGQQFADQARWLRAFVDVHAGLLDEARQAATDGVERAEAGGDLATAVAYLSVLTFIAASEADSAAVVHHTARSGRHLASMGIREPIGRLDPAAERICALAELGHLDDAEAELTEFERRYERFPRPWMRPVLVRARATIAAGRGDIEAAIATAEPVTQWGRFDQARVLLLRGRLLRRARRPGAAAAALTEAEVILAGLGYQAWARMAHEELARASRRRGAAAELTRTERSVAELVTNGMTSKQVAAALFMSHRTVESHIARAYRKLGIRSRAELGRLMT